MWIRDEKRSLEKHTSGSSDQNSNWGLGHGGRLAMEARNKCRGRPKTVKFAWATMVKHDWKAGIQGEARRALGRKREKQSGSGGISRVGSNVTWTSGAHGPGLPTANGAGDEGSHARTAGRLCYNRRLSWSTLPIESFTYQTIKPNYHSPSLVWHVWDTQIKSYYRGVVFSLIWQMA